MASVLEDRHEQGCMLRACRTPEHKSLPAGPSLTQQRSHRARGVLRGRCGLGRRVANEDLIADRRSQLALGQLFQDVQQRSIAVPASRTDTRLINRPLRCRRADIAPGRLLKALDMLYCTTGQPQVYQKYTKAR